MARYLTLVKPKQENLNLCYKDLDEEEFKVWLREGPYEMVDNVKFKCGDECLFLKIGEVALKNLLSGNGDQDIEFRDIALYLIKFENIV